jgi:Putative MetA-pathway of phenol degradation
MKRFFIVAAALGLTIQALPAFASCGTTACAINTNWDEHTPHEPGLSADFRYSYSRADTLRSGSQKIVANPTDPALTAGQEVENKKTINRIMAATLDYTVDEHWGAAVQIPYIVRDHAHSLANTNPAQVGTDTFHASSLGDIRLSGRYRWDLDEANRSGMGVKFGVKLNTGRRDFLLASGVLPNEMTLQPGNGSTDAILGLFWQEAASGSDWSWFAQGTLQSPVKASTQFRPGNQINLDGGTRYAMGSKLSGLMQLNVQWNGADTGTSAALTPTGAVSSGGRIISITPGLSYALSHETQVYGLLQLPIYQYVNGEQLTARYSLSAGISQRF